MMPSNAIDPQNVYVFEETTRMGRQLDIYSRLLADRIIFLGFPITDEVANYVIAQMMFLEAEDPDKDVNLYVNSPGGSVTAGLAIYDTMQYVRPDVSTICIGQASSMGAVLMAAGAPGKRFALPYSRFLLHQLTAGVQGQASDIDRQAQEIVRIGDIIDEVLAKHTGQTLETVRKDSDRDFYMGAEEAKEYGLIDEVFVRDGRETGTGPA